jgi:hypothetical protein
MGETITTNLWFCGWREGEACSASKAGKKTKKNKRERKSLSHLSFLLVPRKRRQKSTLSTYNIRARYLLQLARSLLHTQTHTCATNPSLSLSLPLKTSTTTTITITVRSKNTRADRTFSFPSTRSCARRVPTFVKIPPGSRRSAPLRRL